MTRACFAVVCAAVGLLMTSFAWVGCSSSPSNACPSNGPTYVMHFVEESGNCGQIADLFLYTAADGAVKPCSSPTQQSCSASGAGCMTTCSLIGGPSTFGSGTLLSMATVRCTGSGVSCLSTYQVTTTQQ